MLAHVHESHLVDDNYTKLCDFFAKRIADHPRSGKTMGCLMKEKSEREKSKRNKSNKGDANGKAPMFFMIDDA